MPALQSLQIAASLPVWLSVGVGGVGSEQVREEERWMGRERDRKRVSYSTTRLLCSLHCGHAEQRLWLCAPTPPGPSPPPARDGAGRAATLQPPTRHLSSANPDTATRQAVQVSSHQEAGHTQTQDATLGWQVDGRGQEQGGGERKGRGRAAVPRETRAGDGNSIIFPNPRVAQQA